MTFLIILLLFCSLHQSYCNSSSPESEVPERKLCPPTANVPPPNSRTDTTARVAKLREEMVKSTTTLVPPLNAYIIPRYDAHQSEFLADRDKRLEYISGFTGGYGLAVITQTKAAFWTDDLHYIQANNDLSCNWTLIKSEAPGLLSPADWLVRELKAGMRVGADPKLVPNSEWEILEKRLVEAAITVAPVSNNLVDIVWTENKPAYPKPNPIVLADVLTGLSWKDKVSALRTEMNGTGYDAMVLTSLSEIAWLFNVRARNIAYTPYIRAYAIISKDQILLYADLKSLTDEVKQHLNVESCISAYCVRLFEYDLFLNDLKTVTSPWKKVLVPAMANFSPGASRAVFSAILPTKRRSAPSPLIDMIAIKTPAEKKGMIKAHIRDAAIFCSMMAYLEAEMEKNKDEGIDELTVVNITNQFHLDHPNSCCISYPTMVASGPNTGIPQYVPINQSNMVIDMNKLLIIDTGTHYLDGSTAVARTFHLGQPTPVETEIYTRILMGFINLALLAFPPTLLMNQVDVVARTPFWDIGFDYPHSSGYGIGSFLDVHQSPIILDYHVKSEETLKAGNFLKSEISYYEEDQFGMKLGSVLNVIYKNDTRQGTGYLMFLPITMIPFEPKLINTTMLSLEQKIWLNAYNRRIRSIVGDELLNLTQTNGYNWMVDRTEDIPVVPEQSENRAGIAPIEKIYFLSLPVILLVFRP